MDVGDEILEEEEIIPQECVEMENEAEEKANGDVVVGGFTCCVTDCFSNNKRDKDLSFYRVPAKSKPELRAKWLRLISRENFDPGDGHRVCSRHFVGGKKTAENHLPIIVPKNKHKTPPSERKTENSKKARVPFNVITAKKKSQTRKSLPESLADNILPCQDENIRPNISNIHDDDVNTDSLRRKIQELQEENRRLKSENWKLGLENQELKRRNETLEQKSQFAVSNFKEDPKLFRFYTGLPDYETFKILFDSFGAAAHNLVYIGSNTDYEKTASSEYQKRGRKRTLPPEQEFFLVLVKLRLGLLEEDLAWRAGINASMFSKFWITWLDFLHSKFRSYPIWPTKQFVQDTMPACFEASYPSTRVIIDCTEIYIEKPSSIRSQSATYSNYKHHNTAKGLVGITPAGTVCFIADLYTGRTSDKQAAKDCGLFDLLETSDSLMTDKGFDIAQDLPDGVTLNIPPFLRNDHLSTEQETETRKIASLRVHVERLLSRVKNFRILSTIFPVSMSADLNKIWVICCSLVNFLPPLIQKNEGLEEPNVTK